MHFHLWPAKGLPFSHVPMCSTNICIVGYCLVCSPCEWFYESHQGLYTFLKEIIYHSWEQFVALCGDTHRGNCRSKFRCSKSTQGIFIPSLGIHLTRNIKGRIRLRKFSVCNKVPHSVQEMYVILCKTGIETRAYNVFHKVCSQFGVLIWSWCDITPR